MSSEENGGGEKSVKRDFWETLFLSLNEELGNSQVSYNGYSC